MLGRVAVAEGGSPTSPRRAKLRRRPGAQTRAGGLRTLLRLGRGLLTMYIVSMLVAKGTIESGLGKPAIISLNPKDVPKRMKLRSRKQYADDSCRTLAGVEDPYFARYNGGHCGTTVFESRVFSSGMPREDDDQVAKVTMHYKAFASDDDATEYFWRFWGLHTSAIIPARYYLDVRDRVPRVGDEYRALYYNPDLVVPVSRDDAYMSAHLQYLFRQGRTIVILSFSGFPRVEAKVINPHLARQVAEAISARIHYPFDITVHLRHAALWGLKWGNAFDARLTALWSVDTIVPPALRDAVATASSNLESAVMEAALSADPLSKDFFESMTDLGHVDEELGGEVVANETTPVAFQGSGSVGGGLEMAKGWYADVSTAPSVAAANRTATLDQIVALHLGEADRFELPAVDESTLFAVAGSTKKEDAAPTRTTPTFVFGADESDVVGSAALDYLGFDDSWTECTVKSWRTRAVEWLRSFWTTPSITPVCRAHAATGVVDMVVTVAVPLGLLAITELIDSVAH